MPSAKRKHASAKSPTSSNQSTRIPVGFQSWVKNVIAPALVKVYLQERELRKGARHA